MCPLSAQERNPILLQKTSRPVTGWGASHKQRSLEQLYSMWQSLHELSRTDRTGAEEMHRNSEGPPFRGGQTASAGSLVSTSKWKLLAIPFLLLRPTLPTTTPRRETQLCFVGTSRLASSPVGSRTWRGEWARSALSRSSAACVCVQNSRLGPEG